MKKIALLFCIIYAMVYWLSYKIINRFPATIPIFVAVIVLMFIGFVMFIGGILY